MVAGINLTFNGSGVIIILNCLISVVERARANERDRERQAQMAEKSSGRCVPLGTCFCVLLLDDDTR